MNYNELKNIWKSEEQESFKGWDFSHLKNRWDDEELPWNYKDILSKSLKDNYKLLDMGTGGGEFLLTLNHPFANTSVTEGYEPNVKLCKERLEPLGVEVKQVFNDSKLPFNDNSFDMVINQHESFDLKEVKRILKPNGLFITQQVGGMNNRKLSEALIKNFKPQFSKNNLKDVSNELKKLNFDVLYGDEFYPYLRFKDIGALVYFAKIIPWEFPGFSVDKCFDELCGLNNEVITNGYVESTEHRFIIVCKNIK